MSNTISMETETVQAAVDTLRRGSRYFDRLALQMNFHYRILSTAWLGERGEEYGSQIRRICRLLEERTSELEIMAERLQNEVFEWEAMDKSLGQPVKRYPAVVTAILSGAGITFAGGEVLGASASIYDQMSWADKFALQRELAKKITEFKEKYGLTGSDEEIAAMYADLEAQIKELEEKRRQAQENADRWYNKILPDLPLEGDSEDGVPWRVKADDYEDEIKGYDAQLSALREEQTDLLQYPDLKEQEQALSNAFTDRLKDVKPGNYGSCALYAAARRPDLGSTQSNYEEFTDGAAANYISKYQDSAFQVGSSADLREKVGAGFAVVWKPGVQNSNSTYGHVAIVEEVGKDYVVVSHAGWRTGTTTTLPISKLQELWLIP